MIEIKQATEICYQSKCVCVFHSSSLASIEIANLGMHICMYVCMYVWMNVCMYVYVCEDFGKVNCLITAPHCTSIFETWFTRYINGHCCNKHITSSFKSRSWQAHRHNFMIRLHSDGLGYVHWIQTCKCTRCNENTIWEIKIGELKRGVYSTKLFLSCIRIHYQN